MAQLDLPYARQSEDSPEGIRRVLERRVGRRLMEWAPRVEVAARRTLRLAGPAPDPSGRRVSPGALPQERERWHREGARGAVAARARRVTYRAGYHLSHEEGLPLLDAVRDRLAYRELSQAREMTFRSQYLHESGLATSVDGYLELPSGRTYALEITTSKTDQAWAELALGIGSSHTPRYDARHTILLPVDVLTPDMVEAALRAWYIAHFRWQQGHWSALEGRLPQMIVEPTLFGLPDTAARPPLKEQRRRRRVGLAAERALAHVLDTPDNRLIYQQYGVSVLDPYLTSILEPAP